MGKRNVSENKVKHNHKVLYILIGVLSVSIAAVSIIGFLNYRNYEKMKVALDIDTIYNNIYVNNVNIGGYSKEQAIELLEKEVNGTFGEKLITVAADGKEYNYKYADFGAKYDLAPAVEEAYNYARNGSIRERYSLVKELNDSGEYIPAESTYDTEAVKKAVLELEKELYIAPSNATVKRENGKFNITDGKIGYKLNVDVTVKAICQMIDMKQDGVVNAAMEEIQPEYTSDAFKNIDNVIGSYSTAYKGGDNARITNLKVAASKVNGTVLYPGDVFSTNKALGESTTANGYLPAPTIVDGKLVDSIGGGVCQVSSTLYDAVLYSEIEIVERTNHSLKVGYSDYAFDATLAGDYIDLKFKNSTKYPIYIESYLTSNQVVCNIYGYEEHSPNRKLVFENALISTEKPPAEHVVYDDSLPEGTRKVTVNPLNGYKYKLYKFVYEGDKLIEKVEVNTSYYKPRRAEVTVGTKKEAVPASVTQTETALQSESTQSTETTTAIAE